MEYSINSVSDIAERYIKDQILSANLKSGDKIIEASIADALSISRAPVREALRSLSQYGMIVFSPRKGHFVVELSREEILEVFEIRISLELQVLKILVTNSLLTEDDYQELKKLADRMENAHDSAASEPERIQALNSLDLAFHKYLWNRSGSKKRGQLLESLFYQLLVVMNENVASLGSCKEKAEEHRRLISALRSNDVQQVCQELRQHLLRYIVAALGDTTPAENQKLDLLFASAP